MKFDITSYWYRPYSHPLIFLLLPFSYLFVAGVAIRRMLYQCGMFKIQRFSLPVIVVGNITVGGTGKTPFVIWLVNFLEQQGYRPAIISRGVGGKKHKKPHWVKHEDTVAHVGDEAYLLRQALTCPIVIGVNRPAAVQDLVNRHACDVVISDDGLQHYALGRDIEIALIDGARQFGNQHLLPAGPLREPIKRLQQVDFKIVNGGEGEFTLVLAATELVSLTTHQKINLLDFPHKKIHAVAGIGHPQRFFLMLKNAGFEVVPHIYRDHYRYRQQDVDFSDNLPVVMTEKDAVKCQAFADERHWLLPVSVKMSGGFVEKLLAKLSALDYINIPINGK